MNSGKVQAASEATGPDASTILAQVMSRNETRASPAEGLHEARVAAWNGTTGTLADGRPAALGASCLLRPSGGDHVLVWNGQDGAWILGILQRASAGTTAVISSESPVAIEAPRIGISAQAVHLSAEDFLSSTRNRHAVEDMRTETARVRVSQIGTDIRRATTGDDSVTGTFLQRTGTWISNTTREARLRARTFLFD